MRFALIEQACYFSADEFGEVGQIKVTRCGKKNAIIAEKNALTAHTTSIQKYTIKDK